MITLYYAEVFDYAGVYVHKLKLAASAKQAYFYGDKYVKAVGPAAGFVVRKVNFSAGNVAEAFNKLRRGE